MPGLLIQASAVRNTTLVYVYDTSRTNGRSVRMFKCGIMDNLRVDCLSRPYHFTLSTEEICSKHTLESNVLSKLGKAAGHRIDAPF